MARGARKIGRATVFGALFVLHIMVAAQTALAADGTSGCAASASDACYFSFTPAGTNGSLHYYASSAPLPAAAPGTLPPVAALVALHGHPRDADKIFDAALLAVQRASALDRTLVVAPVFQVAGGEAGKCPARGVPAAQAGDLLWTCASWIEGAPAANGGPTSFAALDALVAELQARWPSLRQITVAGFSAGAQMVQHYIGFAAPPASDAMHLRYVVSDPGSWLYFDTLRPQPMVAGAAVDWLRCGNGQDSLAPCTLDFRLPQGACPAVNRWKYGTESLPVSLPWSGAAARKRYAQADVSYLQGALDNNAGSGTFYKILDKSCAAMAQGPYRLQRGLAYAQYERTLLAPGQNRKIVVVPGCAHDVACVFPSAAARAALMGSL